MPPGEHLYPTGEHVVTNSTALHSAAMHGNTDILDYILQNVDPGMITAIDPNNAGVFHYTAYSLRGKDTSLVSGLIRTLATAWGRVNPEGWFTRDCLGNTPPLAAIKEHNFAVARELLKYPAVSAEELPEALIKALHVQDPDHREESLEKQEYIEFFQALVDAIVEQYGTLDAPEYPGGIPPLHVACTRARVDATSMLLKAGADVAKVAGAREYECIPLCTFLRNIVPPQIGWTEGLSSEDESQITFECQE